MKPSPRKTYFFFSYVIIFGDPSLCLQITPIYVKFDQYLVIREVMGKGASSKLFDSILKCCPYLSNILILSDQKYLHVKHDQSLVIREILGRRRVKIRGWSFFLVTDDLKPPAGHRAQPSLLQKSKINLKSKIIW